MTVSPAPADRLVLALAQINSVVGAVDVNLEKARAGRRKAAEFAADLVMFSELFLAGYPPEDLVLKLSFQDACRAAVEELARDTADGGPAVLIGLPWMQDGASTTPTRCSTAAASPRCASRSICPITACSTRSACSHPGPVPGPVAFAACGSACRSARTSGPRDVVECLSRDRRRNSAVPNGSPYWRGKDPNAPQRRRRARDRKPGCRWSISTRSAARTNWCSTARRFVAQRRPLGRLPAAGLRGNGGHDAMVARRRRLASARRRPIAPQLDERTRPITRPACSACAIMSTRTVSRAWCSACPAASIPRCARPWRSDALGPSACAASCCPTAYTSQESLDDAARLRRALGVRYDMRADRGRRRRRRSGAGAAVCRRAARRHRGKHAGARPRR